MAIKFDTTMKILKTIAPTLALCLTLGLGFSLCPPLQAAEPTPAFMHPDVLRAALAINLKDEQKPQFRAAVTDFFNGRMEALNLLMRRHNQSNIGRKMKSKTNFLLKDMDAQVAEFLTEEQMPAYETYRKTLKSKLRG